MFKIRTVLYAVYMGFIVYSFMNFIAGDRGVKAMYDLYRFEQKAVRNLNDLKQNNRVLSSELKSLKSSSELIRIKARGLGYFGRNEKAVFVKGINRAIPDYQAGKILYWNEKVSNRKRIFRALGFISAVFFLFVFYIGERLKSVKDDN